LPSAAGIGAVIERHQEGWYNGSVTANAGGIVRTYLDLAIIVLSITLIVIIVLQSRGAGLGGLGGGDYGGYGYHARRGVERMLFNLTIVLSVVFFVITLVSVVLVS
jgi:preprotein translocase subunit SecG